MKIVERCKSMYQHSSYTKLTESRIVRLLENGSFKFSLITLKSIHRVLFKGNTRTTAVFMIKHLRSLGYSINNDLFKEHSLYFRNALVLSNYSDVNRNIIPEFKHLESFFEKLLIDSKVKLEKMKY